VILLLLTGNSATNCRPGPAAAVIAKQPKLSVHSGACYTDRCCPALNEASMFMQFNVFLFSVTLGLLSLAAAVCSDISNAHDSVVQNCKITSDDKKILDTAFGMNF